MNNLKIANLQEKARYIITAMMIISAIAILVTNSHKTVWWLLILPIASFISLNQRKGRKVSKFWKENTLGEHQAWRDIVVIIITSIVYLYWAIPTIILLILRIYYRRKMMEIYPLAEGKMISDSKYDGYMYYSDRITEFGKLLNNHKIVYYRFINSERCRHGTYYSDIVWYVPHYEVWYKD